MTKKEKIILLCLLGLAFTLIFFRLGRQDILGDDGHYALRSLGYFDYMASYQQTTPVQWFGYRPVWSLLSFHDHPPLFFLLQFVFMKIFGTSIVAIRLLPALAAFGSVIVLFFLARRMGGVKAAFLATGALVANSYFIWTGRIGLLESQFVFFLLLGLLYLTKALEENHKYFLWAGLYLGLSILTKYTLLPVLPAIFVFLLIKHRWVFSQKKFWYGVIVFVLVFAPVVIYNLAMYKTRGHFDVQFGDLFGQRHEDWTNLQNRVSNASFSAKSVIDLLVSGFSWPYFLVFVVSLIAGVFYAFRRKRQWFYLPTLVFLFLFLFFSFIGAAARWVGVVSPFAALIIGLALAQVIQKPQPKIITYLLLAVLAPVGLFSLFYTLNTNHLLQALGGKLFYADFRVENLGYNQLDRAVSGILSDKRPTPSVQESVRLFWYGEIKPEAINFSSLNRGGQKFEGIIVFDSNTVWFPTVWTFGRWRLYRRFLIATTSEFYKIVDNQDSENALRSLNVKDIYFIESSKRVADQSQIGYPDTKILADVFKKQNIVPEIVRDDLGREAFYIYQGSLY